uniref:Retinoic acid receptor, beta n=1 Tax=Mus musculus TaxID=10090 RepID=A0A286YCR2_MOUSE
MPSRHRVPALRSSSRAHHLHFLLLGCTSPASFARTSHRATTMASVPARGARAFSAEVFRRT